MHNIPTTGTVYYSTKINRFKNCIISCNVDNTGSVCSTYAYASSFWHSCFLCILKKFGKLFLLFNHELVIGHSSQTAAITLANLANFGSWDSKQASVFSITLKCLQKGREHHTELHNYSATADNGGSPSRNFE